jgi:hypothetical protein
MAKTLRLSQVICRVPIPRISGLDRALKNINAFYNPTLEQANIAKGFNQLH